MTRVPRPEGRDGFLPQCLANAIASPAEAAQILTTLEARALDVDTAQIGLAAGLIESQPAAIVETAHAIHISPCGRSTIAASTVGTGHEL